MSSLALTRLLAGVIVVALSRLPTTTYHSLVFGIIFSHYLMGVLYSSRQIRRLAGDREAWTPVLALLALTVLVTGFRIPHFLLYFGLHIIFNEAYAFADRMPGGRMAGRVRALTVARTCFGASVYLFVLRANPVLESFPFDLSFLAMVGSFLVVVPLAISLRTHSAWDLIGFELVGLAFATLSCFVRIVDLDVFLYHTLYWLVYPVARMRPRTGLSVLRFIAINLAGIAAFLVFTPLGGHLLAVPLDQLVTHKLRFFGYIHVSLSFALSAHHPGWIRSCFHRRPGWKLTAGVDTLSARP